jgi:uncharacterized membrane protein YedE/YeeE
MTPVDSDLTEPQEDHDSSPYFLPLVFIGGFIFGIGLAVSQMARPEIVLDFLQFEDFGLAFVMGGAAAVVSGVFYFASTSGLSAPLSGRRYTRRLKDLDREVVVGGGIFGVGWGLSGICPGAAYASLGIGNTVILYGVAGMFVGAYLQGYFRESGSTASTTQPAD